MCYENRKPLLKRMGHPKSHISGGMPKFIWACSYLMYLPKQKFEQATHSIFPLWQVTKPASDERSGFANLFIKQIDRQNHFTPLGFCSF